MNFVAQIDSYQSIAEAFYELAAADPSRVLYRQPTLSDIDKLNGVRDWQQTTYAESEGRVNKLVAYLKSIGVQAGTKVAILSGSRPEWMEADIAILACGGLVTSVYQSLLAHDIAYILFDSGAEIVFAENQEQVDKLLEIRSRQWKMPATEERKEREASVEVAKIICFEDCDQNELIDSFKDIVNGAEAPRPDDFGGVTRDTVASFVYTSGTTGPPKGVVQTHGNHLSNVRQAWKSGMVNETSYIMLFLPLAHSFAKLVGYLGFLTPSALNFAGVWDRKTSKIDPKSVTRDIAESQSTVIPVVPRLLEKMRAGVEAKAEAGLKGKIIGATLWAAREHYKALKRREMPGSMVQIVYKGTTGLRKKIKEALFGPKFVFALSGGAKLPVEVAEFFDALGIETLEGYGLTETCVATNVNRLGHKKIGTVGPVLDDDIELRIAEDGEILYRGPNIALGYHNREAATNKSWDSEGWFHTGDIGSVDANGFLAIEGRKKEIIVTSGGKNIAPHDIEEGIKSSKFVSQAVLVGDGRKYCVALVTLDMEFVKNWAKKQGITRLDEIHKNEKLRQLIWEDVERQNTQLASYETVKSVSILPEDFSVENGYLTPTFKIKRNLVEKNYKELIDSMYK
ncbi:MAG: long-chain fatty acid--CoA ligase [Bdellovibrionales bacterium]|nr:long-chain fatty acid--CoA ligase [Bdellovibrionales bacterium]